MVYYTYAHNTAGILGSRPIIAARLCNLREPNKTGLTAEEMH